MPVTFTLTNTNDSTPANNQVAVDVELMPTIEGTVEAALSAPDTEAALNRTYIAHVTITNTGTVGLPYIALQFGDVLGFEVRPIASPTWDPDAGAIVSNPAWGAPRMQTGGYEVAKAGSLEPSDSVLYYAKVTRRGATAASIIPFAVYGPCGYTGAVAELEFGEPLDPP